LKYGLWFENDKISIMVKSKAWNWDISVAAQWEEPAGEIYPILNRWKTKKYENILDLGCGIGRHSVLFAQNEFKVSATDLGKEGLEKLEEMAGKLKLTIEINHADMVSLPYKDSEFDCILAFHSIYHQDDEGIRKVISEIKRVLKPGGEAFVTFNSKNGTSFNSADVKRISGNTIVKTHGHEEGIPHYYANKEEVEELLKDFEIIEFSHKEEYYPDYIGAHFFVLLNKRK
jgi:ubiquinone/menaquinone biosynthesis C-methylase UbiE